MKRNLFWMLSVLLMLGAATMVMTSCGDDDEPTSCGDDDDPAQGTEQGGQGGGEQTVPLTMEQAKALLVAQGIWTYQTDDGINYYLWFGEADGRGLADDAPVFKFDYSLESESGDFREGVIKLKDLIDYVYKDLSATGFNLYNGNDEWLACKAYKDKTPQGVVAVDLGLPSGTLWASANVGASKPEEYGSYFAWGETEPKTEFMSSNYKWFDEDGDPTKYTEVDELLEPQDDAAFANWGAGWQMPSLEQFEELFNNTNSGWTTQNGVHGYIFTSKTNENSIFLPAAGYFMGSSLDAADSYGFYWSCTLDTDILKRAWNRGFGSDIAYNGTRLRFHGISVRPVRAF